jgi:hypothetical protein
MSDAGLVGLGAMGSRLAGRLLDAGHRWRCRPQTRGRGVSATPIRSRRSPLKRLSARVRGREETEFVLQIVQPSLVGMIDGTVSMLASIFAAAVSANSRTALLVGLATALGAGVSMGISEALSDTGQATGRGSAGVRGAITGAATTFGGVFHSLPFIISNVNRALLVAGVVVGIELFVIALVRSRFLRVMLRSSLVAVTLGGAIVLAIGVAIGSA